MLIKFQPDLTFVQSTALHFFVALMCPKVLSVCEFLQAKITVNGEMLCTCRQPYIGPMQREWSCPYQ